MNQALRIPLRVVFYREADAIIAHCLEFDLLGEGATHEQAVQSLVEAIPLQVHEAVESGNIDTLFTPAPGEYFRRFAEGKPNARLGAIMQVLQLQAGPLDVTDVEWRDYREGGSEGFNAPSA